MNTKRVGGAPILSVLKYVENEYQYFNSTPLHSCAMQVEGLLQRGVLYRAEQALQKQRAIDEMHAKCTRVTVHVLKQGLSLGKLVVGNLAVISRLGVMGGDGHGFGTTIYAKNGGAEATDDKTNEMKELWRAVAADIEALDCGAYEWKAVYPLRDLYEIEGANLFYMGFLLRRKQGTVLDETPAVFDMAALGTASGTASSSASGITAGSVCFDTLSSAAASAAWHRRATLGRRPRLTNAVELDGIVELESLRRGI